MRFSIFAITPLIASALALPAATVASSNSKSRPTPSPPKLPACGPTPQPCSCPAGTYYQVSTSVAIVPASASDLQSVIGNFLQTSWFGTSPESITGTGTIPGAQRHLLGEIPGAGIYPITEELTLYKPYPNNGGFYQKFQMGDAPFYFNMTTGAPGILGGTWDIVDVHAIGSKTSSWLWNIYACFSVDFDFQGFHESAMLNVTSILKSQGKTSGSLIGPFSY
ncbi:hypothetical protein SS1G_08566 [Sclerotinia sclerotiorum 1980 UF-70]|uniref:Uncharacterized protein n=2 Tax=Sclerotinia sclerotiorum (strain ATCC 18683 / 1980 / Ss-1) TaxID=665079 RepID=A7ETB1_SCLS1|nr:hypothetical protein SS1G_08566 [Sclerotinia sclerotiorum 1980 UF-70]APA13061.1 hypothetical protein sscle_10g078310 [Sclerotinia sclerotiorum 1980 UF-70]EDN92703.1 hypothetical protein SS1G_08566 [Sclerotinia sclerotiorum 1980 UF-70]